jgi:ligand-binding sensor domain-containing protein/serine phosphatase RsbU (regulator of sigma subunit)
VIGKLKLKSRILFLSALFAMSFRLYGQEYEFSHLGQKEGLSQSVVNCIFQDSQGFLWFGTQNGLNRFDGYDFGNFLKNPSDPSSLIDNWVYAICEDNSGNLWIGTKKGLAKYNRKSNKFQEVEYKPKGRFIPNNTVNSLCTSSDGKILVNTNGMLIIIEPETLNCSHFQTNFPEDRSIFDQSRPIIEDKHGNIWFGTNSGLCKFTRKTSKFSYFKVDPEQVLSGSDINALFEDFNGNIWVGTNIGLRLLNPVDNKVLNINQILKNKELNYPVKAITRSIDGYIWIATENGGLGRLQFNGQQADLQYFVNDPNKLNALTHNIVYSLFIDKSDILWIGTLNGISKLDLKKKKFNLYRKSNSPNSINLTDNEDGLIWIGTWGAGLNLFNRKTGQIIHYTSKYQDYRNIPNDFVHVVFKDEQKRIWIGTRNGLCIFDPKTKRFTDYRHIFQNSNFPDFSNIRIYCIRQSKNKNIMVGTGNGLYILNLTTGKTNSFFAENSTISGNLVYSVLEDSEQEIWIGTTNGLDRYNPKKGIFKHYKKNSDKTNSIIDNFVVSLCLASDGNIWIGTNSGLCSLDKKTEKFKFFTEFPNNVVYDILEDNQANLWLSSGIGLTKFNSKTAEFTNFGIEDGLQSMEFNIKACFKSGDGEMFFGGMNGFNSFYPDSIQKSHFIPKVAITAIIKENQFGKQPIIFYGDDIIKLTHHDYALSIDFASLDFTHPEKNKYAYEMIGLSDKRIDYGNSRHVTFLNLPAGDYEFKVYGSNSDGIWNNVPAIVRIRVLPPWWRSNYAYLVYVVLIVLIIFIYIKFREKRLKYEKRILEERVEDRTREIMQQKDEIEEQKDEIQAQRDEIEKQKNYVTQQRDQIAIKNNEINDSLLYAKRIQSAVLPLDSQFRNYFSDFFVLYQPKDIISGDFFWIKNISDKCYFAVADCTGHGVPGAFVSMLGITFLNEIVQTYQVGSAGEILDKLRVKIKEAMQQTGKPDEAKDGMDISLAMLDSRNMIIEFAGANSYGLIIQNGKLNHLVADKMPIGIHGIEKPFSTLQMNYNKEDIIYLFSDGYMDQFGGKTRRKFMSQNFIKLIENICTLPMTEQCIKLELSLKEWKGDNEQVDDITILGVKI